MKKLIYIPTLVIAILFVGYFVTKDKKQPADLRNLTPQQLVETYYKSLQAKDYATAEACRGIEYTNYIKYNDDSEFENLKSISDIKISPEEDIKLLGSNFKEVQVVAEYTAKYKKELTSSNGSQIRFIYVAKQNEDSPWKIISIGTGP